MYERYHSPEMLSKTCQKILTGTTSIPDQRLDRWAQNGDCSSDFKVLPIARLTAP